VLVGEPTGIDWPWEYIGVVARGISCFRIVVRGTQMHSSLTDRLPSVNASAKLGGVLARFAELCPRFALEPGCPPCAPKVNVGVTLRGGVFYGVCPGEAEFGVDVRLVPGMRREDLEEDVEQLLRVLRDEDPELDVMVEWLDGLDWLEPQRIDADHPLVAAARGAAADVLGRELPAAVFPGGTDAGYWQSAGMPALPALGPGLLRHAHAPNESVGVDEIVAASRIYALTALRFLAGEDER
jgi:acetylornithine deacetylase/succinyl-diaminopimelate desuccinylase-like protein